MNKLRLYIVSDEYINYLIQFDKRVLSNKEDSRRKERKYLGIVLSINDLNYFIPLSSPKKTDYILNNGKLEIRKSIIPLIRITSEDINGSIELKGTLKFSSMIPVPECALIDYDVNTESDEDYKILVLKELDFIFSHKDDIYKNANVIYKQKVKNMNHIGYIKETVNFKLLEVKCKEYEEIKQMVAAAREE